jgi:heme/copper-type cytochrome/quinol oxidase subunit 2
VLYEFWVPQLNRKMSTVPGHSNYMWLRADKPGSYIGQCSEFCGTQHAWMRILVVAVSSVSSSHFGSNSITQVKDFLKCPPPNP